ncbi:MULTISPECIES: ATP-binding protein [unclassified Pseudoclavibacter]|uniref:ATP-binding protein n=1 Tax=unclassified Pseudoclavibacter TaxID=2615177 RepID=UPI000CE83823|nr:MULTISPECIES: ATP-binding protein [unclassified Pseudoclavibacter]MBF4551193.1 ATP-binding protein [Pseudoclavibacter sp. VKM Ac-2888]PPF36023.1 ATPase [Pseudoclavibacter sp. AY1H1]
MDPVKNPYVPGAGRKPAALVGRDSSMTGWRIALQRAENGITDQPFVLYGLRGVGKTVLLTQFRHDAEDRDWWVVQIEAGSDRELRELIGEGLYEPLSDISRPSAGRKVLKALRTALSFKASYDANGSWTFGVDLSDTPGGGADSGVLHTDLRKIIKDVGLAAREEGVGLAILIDEAQDLSAEELTTLAAVTQSAAQDNWPVLFALAGLPNLPQILAEAKSYTERFQFNQIERLSRADAHLAIAQPSAAELVTWAEDAVQHLITESGQYPYFIQQFGREAWNVATGSQITLADSRLGVATGQNLLDNGFFRARWDRTTASEKRYLRAMCPEGDAGVGSGEVAARLKKSISSLGPARAQLIHKGLIYAPDHGVVAFTVPGMASFIERQIES